MLLPFVCVPLPESNLRSELHSEWNEPTRSSRIKADQEKVGHWDTSKVQVLRSGCWESYLEGF